MSTWAFPRKVATVIKNETGTVVWGFTKAGFIYGVERYAQHVVVADRLVDVEAWLNEPDQDKGFSVWMDFFNREDSEGNSHFFDGNLALYILLNTGIRMAGHSAIAGTIVASAFPQLPLTFIVGSTALCVAASDLGGQSTKKKKSSNYYTTAITPAVGILAVVYGPGGYAAYTSWNVGKFALGCFLGTEIGNSLPNASFFSERNSEPPPDRKERGATGQAPDDRQYGPDKTLTSPSDALSTGDVGAASKAAGAVVGAVITGVMAGSLLE